MSIYLYILLASCEGFMLGVLYMSRERDLFWWIMLLLQIVLLGSLVLIWHIVGAK